MLEHIKFLLRIDNQRLFLANEFLYHEGNTADHIYCVEKGRVITFKKSTEANEAKQALISFVKPGQILGLSSLHKNVYQHSAKALSPVTACVIPNHQIQEYLNQNVSFKLTVMQRICQEISQVEERSLKIYNKGRKQRIAFTILDMLQTYGTDEAQNINHSFPLECLSDFLGITPNYFSKALDDLHAEGFIQKKVITFGCSTRLPLKVMPVNLAY